MKKTRWKRWISLLLVLTMVLVPTFSAQAKSSSFAADYIYDENGNRTGIRSVMIDGMDYYDIDGGAKEGRASSAAQLKFLMRTLQSEEWTDKEEEKKSLLQNWADLAYPIYGANNSYCSCDSLGMDKYKSDGEIGDLSALLAGDATSVDTNNSALKTTGLQVASSLSEVRDSAMEEAADILSDCFKKDIVTGWVLTTDAEAVENGFNFDGDALPCLNDDSTDTVLYTLASYGQVYDTSTGNSYLDVFGLAFYDFKLQVIANDELSYITAAEGYSSLEDASNNGAPGVTYSTGSGSDNVMSYYQNGTKGDADVGMEFTQTNSMEVSNEFSETKTYTYGEMIGSETSLGLSLSTLFGGSVSQVFKNEITTQEALETGYTDTTSVTKETSSTVSTSMNLPAQTAAAIESSTSTTDVSLDYDCPVAITYKVAVFAFGGNAITSRNNDRYSLSGFGGSRQFMTTFGSDSSIGGTDAVTNLYNRAILYADTPSFDRSYGNTYMYEYSKNLTQNYLNWDDILEGRIVEEDLRGNEIPITVERYEAATGDDGTLTVGNKIDSYDYESPAYAGYTTNVYTSSSFKDAAENSYTICTGEVYDENGNGLNGGLLYNENTGSYYKMASPIDGDESYTVKFYYSKDEVESTPDETPAPTSLNYDNQMAAEELTPEMEEEYAVRTLADAKGDESVIWLTTHTPMSITGGTINTEEKSMTSEIYGIEPIYPLDSIKVSSGQVTFDMLSGSTLNLDNIEVEGFNANDVAYYGFNQDKGDWVLIDADGNELSESKVASLETDGQTGETLLAAGDEGTVYLKYVIDEDTTNYTYMDSTKKATNASLSSTAKVRINVSSAPFTGTVEASGSLAGYVNDEPINLADCSEIAAIVRDETGKKISNASVNWEAELDEDDGIILENDTLSFTKEGTYQIRATYGSGYSNWITVEALPEKEIKTLTIADTSDNDGLTHVEAGTIVDLSLLAVSADNQYGDDWSDFEDLIWYVDDVEVVPTDGSCMYTATEGGTHTIYAVCDGVTSNKLTLNVTVTGEGVTLNKSSLSMKTGDEKQLSATVSPSDSTDTLTWASSDKKVATVSSDGTITAVGAGTATITVTTSSGYSASCDVSVALAKGETFKDGIYTYKVKNSSTDGSGEVAVTGFVKGKSTDKVKIASKVTCAGTTYQVTSIASKAFKGEQDITSVNTGKNVTTIGKGAFRNCKKLKKAVISDSVKEIGANSFFKDKKLKNLTIGKNVKTIGAHAFCEDINLKKITIKSKKLKKVGAPHAFINVGKAKVTVPSGKLKSYKNMLTKRGLNKAVFSKMK